jgi:GT2 family glycosyltransferase
MNKLSIVIPVFNKWNFTKSCLNDLMQLSSDHEIIIIDNGSSDETNIEISKLDKDFNQLKNGKAGLAYYRFEENQGFAKGCNKGYQISTGNNIIFINNDIRVKSKHENWTQIILDSIKENTLVGPTGGMIDPINFQFLYETRDPNKPKNYMSGWCLAASRSTWEKLHIPRIDGKRGAQIFSEEFFCYFEDTDLGFRASKLSIEFRLVDIPVVHFGKITSGQISTHKLYSEARKIFITKWSGKNHDITK